MFNNFPSSIYKLAMKSNDDTGSCNDYCAIRIAIKSWCIIENVVRMEANNTRLVGGNTSGGGIRSLGSHSNVARDKEKSGPIGGLNNTVWDRQKVCRLALAAY